MELLNFLRVLYGRKWLILLVVSTAVIATYFITRSLPSTYVAQSQLASGVVSETSVQGEEALQYYEMSPKFTGLIDIIRSETILSLLSYRLILHDLQKNESFRDVSDLSDTYTSDQLRNARNLFRAKLEAMEMLSEAENNQVYGNILRDVEYHHTKLKEKTTLEIDPVTEYLVINFEDRNPALAAYAANTLADEFIRYYKNIAHEKANNSIEFLSKLAAQRKQQLNVINDAQFQIKVANSGSKYGQRARIMMMEQSELLLAKDGEERKILILSGLLENLEKRLGEKEKTFIQNQQQKHEQELADLMTGLQQLNKSRIKKVERRMSTTSTKDSIEVIRNQISALTLGLRDNASGAISLPSQEKIKHHTDVKTQLEEALLCKEFIETEIKKLQQGANWLVYMQDDDESAEARDEYITVLGRLNNQRIAALNPSSPIIRVGSAVPPTEAVPTQYPLLITLSGVVSLAICMLLIFLLEYVDVTLRTPYFFERFTGLKTLGGLNVLNTSQLDLPQLFQHQQADPSLESFKQNLRKIRFELLSEEGKIILFTSSQAKTGKSAIMLSLAYSLSLNNKRVLILDTNFKNQDLTQICHATPKLEEYFQFETPVSTIISHTGLYGVDIIGSEGSNSSPSEVLPQEQFTHLLLELEKKYDYIFMEGPSMNTYSDTKELSEYADRILPVFSAKTSIRQQDRNAINYMRKQDGKLMGAILNNVALKDLT
ncbi:MAG: hypothetical protein AAF824_22240 [Bacteroidota bacterium]